MRNKKRSFTSLFIFLLCLGLVYVVSKSFAYEVITRTDQSSNNAEVKNVSETPDYVTFSIRKFDNTTDIIGGKITIAINKKYSTINPSTLKAKVEISANNSTFETYGEKSLIYTGDQVIYEELELPYRTTYFRISLYSNGTILKLDRRNVDCTINVTSTTASIINYTSSGTHNFTATSSGIHRFELWGAAGNYNPDNMQDQVGAGAYTKGEIKLDAGYALIVNVGEQKTGNDFGSVRRSCAGKKRKNKDAF